jgi:hypothetical protein
MPTLPDFARCLNCDYSLRQLPESRCPECGRAFDAADELSYRGHPRVPAWVQAWCEPLPTDFNRAFTAGGALALLAFVWPGSLFPLMLTPCLLVPLVMVWGLRVSVQVALHLLFRRRGLRPPASLRPYLHAPIVCLVVLIALFTKAPARLYLLASLPFMQRYVELARTNPQALPDDAWVGLYPARSITTRPGGGFSFAIHGTGFMDVYGIAYLPQGSPSSDPAKSHHRLLGEWYSWCIEWD